MPCHKRNEPRSGGDRSPFPLRIVPRRQKPASGILKTALRAWRADRFHGVIVAGRCCVRGPAMDTRRSLYLAVRQDDIDAPDSDASWVGTTDIPYIMPANDNLRVKDRMSARCGTLLRRLIACIASVGRIRTPIGNVVRSAVQAASRELVAKLIKAGYLRSALRNDSAAIANAIVRLMQDLRGGGDDGGPQAA
jgi:hypothetical protein